MTVTTAVEHDLAGIHSLELCFAAEDRWSETAWRDELVAADRWVGVVRDSGHVVAAATFQVAGDLADLHRVVVAPSHRGRGLARDLVSRGMAWAVGRGAASILLEVAADNGPARTLYASLGFQELTVRRDYYGAGRDAVVMSASPAQGQGDEA